MIIKYDKNTFGLKSTWTVQTSHTILWTQKGDKVKMPGTIK